MDEERVYPPTLRELAITIRTCLYLAENDDPTGIMGESLSLMANVCNARIVKTLLDGGL